MSHNVGDHVPGLPKHAGFASTSRGPARLGGSAVGFGGRRRLWQQQLDAIQSWRWCGGAGAAGAGGASGDASTDATNDVSLPSDASADVLKDAPVAEGWPTADANADGADDVQETGPIDADFSYDGGGQTVWNSLPDKCRDAAEKGVVWLVSQQNANGSWASAGAYGNAATGLSVVKLETYAIEKGISPFDPNFVYRNQVIAGLNYLFTQLVTVPLAAQYDMNSDGLGVRMSGESNYNNAIALMAITAGRGVTQVVNVPGSQVDGWTYERVAQDMVDAFAECQVASQGGWRYSCPSGNSDNSVSQYVTLGLEYAEHPDYSFMATIPQFVRNGLANWVAFIQDGSGGSSYASPGDWVNPYKTGALLQQHALLHHDSTTPPVQAALNYLNAHWNEPIGSSPADYMAMWSIMKGLVAQQINTVGAHDWYQEYCDVLVAQQQGNGSWPASGYDATGGILATDWALLVLEKAAPAGLY
jgi:hypothetical protein